MIWTKNYTGPDRRRNGYRNGDRDLRWWIMVGAVGIVFSLGNTRITALETDLRTIQREQMDRTERIASLEQNVRNLAQQLDRVEGKVDRLLDRNNREETPYYKGKVARPLPNIKEEVRPSGALKGATALIGEGN